MVQEVTKQNFKTVVLDSKKPVIVDFWAEWCGPCRMLSPIIADLSTEMKQVSFAKLDTEKNPELAAQYNVMSLPSLLIFKNGQEVDRLVGYKPKPALKAELLDMI
jgi:thioredoxin 1